MLMSMSMLQVTDTLCKQQALASAVMLLLPESEDLDKLPVKQHA